MNGLNWMGPQSSLYSVRPPLFSKFTLAYRWVLGPLFWGEEDLSGGVPVLSQIRRVASSAFRHFVEEGRAWDSSETAPADRGWQEEIEK